MATQVAVQKPVNGGAVQPVEQPAAPLTHAIPSSGIYVVINGGEPRMIAQPIVDDVASIRLRKSKGGEAYSLGYWLEQCLENGAAAVLRSLDYAAQNKALRILGKALADTPEDKRGEVATKLMQELKIGSRTVEN